MSLISFHTSKNKEGFTPYQSQLDHQEISLFSKLNLNDHQSQVILAEERVVREDSGSHCSFTKQPGKKKRKMSEELMINDSKIGNNTYLNRSLIGKSSLNFENNLGLDQELDDDLKKDISENSCPVGIAQENHSSCQEIMPAQDLIEVKPRFTKTKNLLRNMSSYLHKYVLYNKRCHCWLFKYFAKQHDNLFDSSHNIEMQEEDERPFCRNIQLIEDESHEVHEKSIKQSENSYKSNSNNSSLLRKKSICRIQRDKWVLAEVRNFQEYVREISLSNFSDYQEIWTCSHKYKGLYRQACLKYYIEDAYGDINRSRLTIKEESNRFLFQFIEGLLEPHHFNRFR